MKLCFIFFLPKQFQERTSVSRVKEFQNIQHIHIMHWWVNSEVAKVFKLYFQSEALDLLRKKYED